MGFLAGFVLFSNQKAQVSGNASVIRGSWNGPDSLLDDVGEISASTSAVVRSGETVGSRIVFVNMFQLVFEQIGTWNEEELYENWVMI